MIIALLVLAVAASAQHMGLPVKSGPVGLVSPIPDGPLSVQQVEERTSTLPDGTSNAETLVSHIYRDRAGRVRTEWHVPVSPGRLSDAVYLVDPVARSVAILLMDSKIAIYLVAPNSSSGSLQVGSPALGKPLPAGNWQTRAEALRTRMVEGIEVEGARIVQTSAEPPLIAVQERWFSNSLGLTLAVEASGPGWKHTAKLQNVDHREPDPALFVIPPDFTVQGQ